MIRRRSVTCSKIPDFSLSEITFTGTRSTFPPLLALSSPSFSPETLCWPFEAALQSHVSEPHNRPACQSSCTGPEASWLQHPHVWQVSQHLASLLGFLGKGYVPGWQLCWRGKRKEKSQVPGALLPGRTPGPSPLQPLKMMGGNFTIIPGKLEQ